MAKITPGDLKAILRQFDIKGADDSDKRIDTIKESSPSPTSMLVSFRFNNRRYCVIYDETADDDLTYLTQLAGGETGSSEGSFFKNPTSSTDTYGLFFKGKTVYLYLAEADKERLDIMLAEMHPEISRSTWQKHIKAGRVRVNSNVVSLPKYEISPNDSVQVDLPQPEDHSGKELPVIFSDKNVIVINKPVGVLTHTKGALSDEFTVADFFRRFTSVGLATNRPGIIHRLDRDTSGVLIGAKTEAAAKLLGRQFSERKAKKTYTAIVSGKLKQKEATIELPIGRNPTAPSTFRVDPNGRMAITHYKVLAENSEESLVELQPVTGRTHQLRVHMAYLGTPIVGDRVYGRPADRLLLHARSLEITIPTSDRRVFEAPLPAEFTTKFTEAS